MVEMHNAESGQAELGEDGKLKIKLQTKPITHYKDQEIDKIEYVDLKEICGKEGIDWLGQNRIDLAEKLKEKMRREQEGELDGDIKKVVVEDNTEAKEIPPADKPKVKKDVQAGEGFSISKEDKDFVLGHEKLSENAKIWLLYKSGFNSKEINELLQSNRAAYVVWAYTQKTPQRAVKAMNKFVELKEK